MESLSKAERRVLGLMLEGLSMKEIAQRIGCSHRTVEDHRRHMYAKMKVHTAVQLVIKVLSHNE